MPHRNKKTLLLGAWGASIVLLIVALFVLDRARNAPISIPAPVIPPSAKNDDTWWTEVLQHAAGPVRGNPKAPFTIVEFGDFQCPLCGKARPAIEAVVNKGKANLYFVNCPLPMHKYALGAAEAADSAAAQGRFWDMYDELYENQSDLRPEMMKQYGDKIGISGSLVETDVASKKYAGQIEASLDVCRKLDVEGTPSVIVRNNATGGSHPAAGSEVAKLMALLNMKK